MIPPRSGIAPFDEPRQYASVITFTSRQIAIQPLHVPDSADGVLCLRGQRMARLGTLGGLSLPDLLHRTVRESWEDSVFGQCGRMAFYHFLAIFPALLLFLNITAHIPDFERQIAPPLSDLTSQVLPGQMSQLLGEMIHELSTRTLSGMQLVFISAGAAWAAFNGTWAMVYGLNKAYEVRERRSSWQLGIAIAGVTMCLAVTAIIAVFMVFFGSYFATRFHLGRIVLRIIEWLILIGTLTLSFGVLYRFAPDLRDPKWEWSTPGALCALLLWIASSLAARVYFDYVNSYTRSYGRLSSVVILLLWLYLTNAAMLIGGEMNSEIQKATHERLLPPGPPLPLRELAR